MNDLNLNTGKTRHLSVRGGLFVVLGLMMAAGLMEGCGGGGGGGGCADTDLQLSWHLVQNGVTVECLQGDTVTVVVDDSAATTEAFPCSDHSEVTMPVEGGVTHNIAFTLTDGDGNLLSSTNDMGLSVLCGGVTVAPEVAFEVN